MNQAKTDRRELIKKALILAPVYAAPAILISDKRVMAQVISAACTGQICATLTTDCHASGSCFCFSLADGSGFCGVSSACGADCASAEDCGAGFVCQVDTCCGDGGVCIPDTTQCVEGDPAPTSSVGPGTTTAPS